MAKKLNKSSKTKVSKDQLRSSLGGFSAKKTGKGRAVLFSKNIEAEIKKNPQKVVNELSQHFAMLPMSEIEANPGQPRKDFDPVALDELSASIRIHGLVQPITVRRFNDHEFQIISGERRFRASKLAGLTEIPAYIRIANDQTLLEMALIENIQRQDLNPIEVAVSYYRLKEECELTDLEVAKRVGKKRSTVSNYLRLLDLHVEVIEALKTKVISMGHAKALAGIADKFLQKELLYDVIAKKMSVRATEKAAKNFTANAPKAVPKQAVNMNEYKGVVDDFKAFFGTIKVKINITDKDKGSGRISIDFKDTDELNQYFKRVEQ